MSTTDRVTTLARLGSCAPSISQKVGSFGTRQTAAEDFGPQRSLSVTLPRSTLISSHLLEGYVGSKASLRSFDGLLISPRDSSTNSNSENAQWRTRNAPRLSSSVLQLLKKTKANTKTAKAPSGGPGAPQHRLHWFSSCHSRFSSSACMHSGQMDIDMLSHGRSALFFPGKL
jgi:hypothetical protein